MAAVGAGIDGRIHLVDATGRDRYVDTRDGHFSFNLVGMQAPVLLKAQWNDASGSRRLYSFASADGVVNITPLTHFAVMAATAGTSPDTLFAAPSASAFAAVQAALPAAISRLQFHLQSMMLRYGVVNANPFTFRFAPDHTGMDALLDNLQVSYTGDNVMLADKATGATLMAAPVANLAAALAPAHWSVDDASRAAEVHVAINSKGMGLSLWTESVNARWVLKARQADGVDAGRTLSSSGDAAAPRVAFDAAGNAHALWTELSNQRNTLWASRFDASTQQWSAARMLSSASAVDSVALPDLVVDHNGHAVAAWLQADGRLNHFDGWAAQYSAATGNWSAPSQVTDGVNTIRGLRLGVNAAGQGLLVWQQERGDGSSTLNLPVDLWARSVSTTGNWGTGHILNRSAGKVSTVYMFGQPALSVNAMGEAVVLWSQRLLPATPMEVHAALFKPASGWQDATAITLKTTEDSYDPEVALDDAGNAIAVWQQQTDYGAYGGANRYVAGVGWGTASHFVDSKLGDAFLPSLAMDGVGNATVVWYRWSPTNAIDLMVNHYRLGSGWGGPQVFAPMGVDDAMTQSPPRVAANAMGQTVVVWGFNLSAVASWR